MIDWLHNYKTVVQIFKLDCGFLLNFGLALTGSAAPVPTALKVDNNNSKVYHQTLDSAHSIQGSGYTRL